MKLQSTINIVAIVAIIMFSSMTAFSQKEIKTIYGDAVIYVNKDYVTHAFSKLLIITGSHDRDMNTKILTLFSKNGVVALSSMDLLPPIKEYSDEEIKKICAENNVDGIVKITVKDKQKSNARVLAQTKFYLEASLYDLKSNITAVNFVGNAAAMEIDKAVYNYFRAIMDELKPLLNR